jgi:hypothetical protein
MKQLREYMLLAALSVLLLHSFTSYKAYAQNKGKQDALQPVQGLTVFDGNGKRVGTVLGFAGGSGAFPSVAFRLDGRLIILNVERHRFTGSGFTGTFGSFYFESANCTGTPFVPGPAGSGDTLAPGHILDGTFLLAPDGAARTIIVRSQGSTSLPTQCEIHATPFPSVASPWRFLIDLADEFQPPFTLR